MGSDPRTKVVDVHSDGRVTLEGQRGSWADVVARAREILEADRLWQQVKPLPPGTCLECRGTGDMNQNQQERVWDMCETCGGSGELTLEQQRDLLQERLGFGRCYPQWSAAIKQHEAAGHSLCYDDMTAVDIAFWNRWADEKGLD